MLKNFHLPACLALLLPVIALSIPVRAEDGISRNGGMRQELREERQQIRMEHERLEAQKDSLKLRCMNVKGQEASLCRQEWQNLKEQREALHQRMRDFRAELEAVHPKKHAGHTAPSEAAPTGESQN